MMDQLNLLADRVSDGEREQIARRILRNPRSHPDHVRAARYILCVIERKRTRALSVSADELPSLG